MHLYDFFPLYVHWVLKLPVWKYSCIGCIGFISILVAFVWLFPGVCFQMFPQSVGKFDAFFFKCVLRVLFWKDAQLHWLHLFVFLLCFFLICPQIIYMKIFMNILVAFVWLFPGVCFQMFPQSLGKSDPFFFKCVLRVLCGCVFFRA